MGSKLIFNDDTKLDATNPENVKQKLINPLGVSKNVINPSIMNNSANINEPTTLIKTTNVLIIVKFSFNLFYHKAFYPTISNK